MKMYYKCLLIVSFIAFAFMGQAQKSNGVYVELLGNGTFYSVNYEYRFPKTESKWGVRAGVGLLPVVAYSVVQGNYLFGTGMHRLEVGLGATVLTGFGDEKGNNQIAANACLQYRLHTESGFFLRIGYAPIFIPIDENDTYSDIGKIFWVWPGVGAGYSF